MNIPPGPRPDGPEGPVVGHLEQAVLEILTPVEIVPTPGGLVYKPGFDDFANAALLIVQASEAGAGLSECENWETKPLEFCRAIHDPLNGGNRKTGPWHPWPGR